MKYLLAIASLSAVSASSLLRGQLDATAGVEGNPPDFNCFHSTLGRHNPEVTCEAATANDGSSCVWCPMSTGSGDAGACLSRVEAVLANGKYGLSCPMSTYVKPPVEEETETGDGIPDVKCFMAAWNAENAETACGQSKDKDGDACVWCQTDGDVMGACLSRVEAGSADGQFGLKCPTLPSDNDASAIS